MKKLFACTTAIVLLAGGLVGCGSNGTGDSKVLETTRAVSEDGWGSGDGGRCVCRFGQEGERGGNARIQCDVQDGTDPSYRQG